MSRRLAPEATVVVPPPGRSHWARIWTRLCSASFSSSSRPTASLGLYVRNLTTGAEASLNADRVFPAASLYKLPIMVETLRQIQLGRISADQMLVVSRANIVPGSGVLQGRVGDSLPVREVLRLMIGGERQHRRR